MYSVAYKLEIKLNKNGIRLFYYDTNEDRLLTRIQDCVDRFKRSGIIFHDGSAYYISENDREFADITISKLTEDWHLYILSASGWFSLEGDDSVCKSKS